MIYSREERLFSEFRLDNYLRQRSQALQSEVLSMPIKQLSETPETELIKKLFSKYQIEPLVINDKAIEISPKEEMITSPNELSGGSIQGLSINVSIPFSGFSELFRHTPSTWSPSGTPDANIQDKNLVLHYETTEKDPERIKTLWLDDIKVIKQNLNWIENDLNSYHNTLERNIIDLLARRKKQAEENKSLIEKLLE